MRPNFEPFVGAFGKGRWARMAESLPGASGTPVRASVSDAASRLEARNKVGWDCWGDQVALFDHGPVATRRQPSRLVEENGRN